MDVFRWPGAEAALCTTQVRAQSQHTAAEAPPGQHTEREPGSLRSAHTTTAAILRRESTKKTSPAAKRKEPMQLKNRGWATVDTMSQNHTKPETRAEPGQQMSHKYH